MVLQDFVMAFMAFVVVVDPVGTAAVFLVLSKGHTKPQRRTMAIKATLVSLGVLMAFGFGGTWLLEAFGISLPAFKTAGGVLLLYIGFEMVFNADENTLSESESREAKQATDISVFPMAIPMIAGPGSMGLIILYMGDAITPMQQVTIISAMTAVIVLVGVLMILGSVLLKFFGVTVLNVISRILGVILCALSVQFIFDGIGESGLLLALSSS